MTYTVTTKNNVLTESQSILADKYGSLFLKNIGTDAVMINDNIPLSPGSSFSFDNQPYVVIAENTIIRFMGNTSVQKLLVIKSYYKEVK